MADTRFPPIETLVTRETVPELVPEAYSGLWHEIFKLPFIWETECVQSTANYSYDRTKDPYAIGILNTCLDENNEISSQRTGVARMTDPNNPGQLTVSFDENYTGTISVALQRIPISKAAPYWIHYTDYENYSLVGGPDRKFLWLLARKPSIPVSDMNYFGQLAAAYGYDISRVISRSDRYF